MSTVRTGGWMHWGFVGLMLALTALFLMLGLWQWQRMGDKQALIATVIERTEATPVELPTEVMWPELDFAAFDYRPVTVTGRFVPEETVLVFTSLTGARGTHSGPGYWVMTPLALEQGGTIWINRGFVPDTSRAAFAGGGLTQAGTVTLSGIARLPEEPGPFTPGIDATNRIDWIRSVERLSRLAAPALAPFAPLYIDMAAGEPGALPQGGETVVEFPDNHLGYAMTWFGFALLTPVLLGFWLRRPRNAEKG